MTALRIEIIVLVFAVHAHALCAFAVQKFTESACTGPLHRRIERLGGAGNLAVGLALLALRLAVRFEAAALVQVKQRAADFVRLQFLVQRKGAEDIRFEFGDLFRLDPLGGHQVVRDQSVEKGRAPPEIAIAPPPHPARHAPPDGERFSGFRYPSIRKNPRPQIDDLRVVFDKAPADTVCADVQPKPCPHSLSPCKGEGETKAPPSGPTSRHLRGRTKWLCHLSQKINAYLMLTSLHIACRSATVRLSCGKHEMLLLVYAHAYRAFLEHCKDRARLQLTSLSI